MDKYYYFASQLPLLKFGEKTHVDREYFLKEAQKWLSVADLASLRKIDINSFALGEESSGPLEEYKDFERLLREELKFIRSGLKQDIDYKSLQHLSASLLEGTPLEIERKLLLLRWRFVEEKEEGHYFDLEFLGFYFLKLQILERLFSFDKQKGTVVFDQLCETRI